MTDDVRSLLDRAAPTTVTDLDLPRALRDGRRRARRRTATITSMSTLAVAGVVAATVAVWPLGRSVAVDPSSLDSGLPAELAAAGCTPGVGGSPTESDHFDPADAPPADVVYDVALPSAGPHMSSLSAAPAAMPDVALDVRAVVHNLEHGAVAVWVDTEAVSPETVEAVEQWTRGLHDDGFVNGTGGSIVISPTPADADVALISLRAWGEALDCEAWSAVVADAFVAEHFGTRGRAPERNLTPYPDPDPLASVPR